ncbi:16S rRNA (guanine(966)-N(2))-methyltransferase RsmD [Falsiporphyromonas endometrii]|uniref:16S rRNA (Guanine(966)-N(2))-methyltransferase RsmD n=1 Tax=Falsiporphyromonas endometrii TaxID=1387297 RepID=A0ABV9K593_9PORP|nr:16S rRNA (guanine(966)-N(2))-methyltransferase RsmD [Porphyromonadaceae bacterium]
MRIISGKYGKRRFDVPKSFNARPTTDLAKENLFNVLNNLMDFEGIRALDVFSGTGSISLELISRGAANVLAVELRNEHANFIRKTAKILGCEGQLRVLSHDALKFLAKAGGGQKFDFIFADPPYALPELQKIPSLIFGSDILMPGGIFVLEHPKEYDFSEEEHFFDHRVYGSVNFSFFTIEEQ